MTRQAPLLVRTAIAVAAAFTLIATAQADDVHIYRMHDIATHAEDADLRAQATEIESIYADLERVSGVEATLLYSTSSDINAFATFAGDEKVVVVEAGFVDYAKQDRDAVAAALGHELGHHKADHIRGGQRKRQGVRVLGAILGAVVGAKIGGGNTAISDAVGDAFDAGAGLVALKFNRNQELEADRLSVDWMIQASYNPEGMLRLQHLLAELEKQHSHAVILSTHPTSAKRYEAAEKLIAHRAPPEDLLRRAPAPLADEKAIASATAAIGLDHDARISEVLRPSETPAAALLDSGSGMNLADYAALSNELEWAGDEGRAAVLKRHKLTRAQSRRIDETFETRMQNDETVANYFNVHFFRAAKGRFAAYGRDLADSLEKGQTLKLDPPTPISEASALLAELGSVATSGSTDTRQTANETTVLERHRLSRYDFRVVHAWWMRKVQIAALTGDDSLIHAYLGGVSGNQSAGPDANTKAEGAGVHMGSNVRIGPNVRIGGKPVAETPQSH